MDKLDRRLKIQLTHFSKSQKKFSYRVLDGECKGIFVDILKQAGGNMKYLADNEVSNSNIEKYPTLWLVVHPVEEFLCGGQTYLNGRVPLAQDLLMENSSDEGEREMLPIIHITTTSIFLPSMYTMAPQHRYIPRYHLIIDNSIWNYHVSIFEPHEIEFPKDDPNTEFILNNLNSFQDSFIDVLDSINNNYKRYLYGLHVAREYADLNARMTAQAYLTGTHAKGVSPFVFHSEHAVKLMIKNEFKGEGKVIEKIKDQKWRILLLDDKANTKMGCMPSLRPQNDFFNSGNSEKLPWDCKLAIIEKTISHCFGWDNIDNKVKICHRPCNDKNEICNDCCILIEYAQSLDEAEIAIQNRKYDIILLDYLLDQTDGIHYGYELLDKIYKDQDSNKNDESKLKYKTIKPHHHLRMYCMFISAYSSAVHDQLLAEGLNQSEKYWFISLGACPTNTPQLFLYNLLKLMDKRIEDSYIKKLSVDGIIDTLGRIYNQEELIRKNAGERYQDIQSYQYYYRTILKDYKVQLSKDSIFNTNGSVLMTSFMNNNINLGGLLEHMAQLVHLTAFGTVRQWSEMWEEYVYFKSQLTSQINKRNQSEFKTLCSNIESYIMSLKTSAI